MLIALTACAAAIWLLAGGRIGRWVQPAVRKMDAIAERAAAAALQRISGRGPGEDVVALCGALAAELRAGAPPDAALILVSSGSGLMKQARAAALLGEPIGPALAADAERVREDAVAAAALRGMSACWLVAADSGAGLADGMDRVAALAGAQQRVGADLRAEVAAPRATARILGLLPVLGLAMGELLGARPAAWLLTSPVGWACLATGIGLMAVGRLWSARIVAAAMPGHGRGA